MEKTKLCQKCKEQKSVFGFHQHVKYCNGTPKAPKEPVPEVQTEPLKVEAEPLPEKIVIQQDYAPVPKLEVETQITEEPEPEKPPEQKPDEKPQTPDASEKVDFSGIEDVFIGIINKRLRTKDIEELTSEEQQRIRRSWNVFCEKHLELFLKYADVLNLGFALVFPLVTRAPQLAAKKEQAVKEVPAVEAKVAVRADSEAERARKEFEELTRK